MILRFQITKQHNAFFEENPLKKKVINVVPPANADTIQNVVCEPFISPSLLTWTQFQMYEAMQPGAGGVKSTPINRTESATILLDSW